MSVMGKILCSRSKMYPILVLSTGICIKLGLGTKNYFCMAYYIEKIKNPAKW